MADYLLDTNYLVYLVDPNADETKKREVLIDFEQKLEDENNRFVLTPLIRYEVLRGVKWQDKTKLAQLEHILKQFKSLDIRDEIADLARDLYRFDEYESKRDNVPKNLEKRKFDMFHYATAKLENLQVLSKDSDLSQIEKLHERMRRENS
ncbi:type II toxin-antitoxin system VapC family toxin [Rodentibacter sp. Ppn85]|uniref:type II toxin-antitoxin system VapC family toxin n=1 Tax=Rodentibacter sp. Ppn85 TaxID=1908525 RepID=UPI000986BFE2|nr:PIN domain-containing protein [Rodentibacter sp. Ppn85]OOF61556.1 PIN domain-containing protein [Rodentibacter sp. Ppn85]